MKVVIFRILSSNFRGWEEQENFWQSFFSISYSFGYKLRDAHDR